MGGEWITSINYAKKLRQEGRFFDAREVIISAQIHAPSPFRGIIRLGIAECEYGDLVAAKTALNIGRRIGPNDDPQALHLELLIYEAQGDIKAILRSGSIACDAGVALTPAILKMLAKTALEAGDAKRAERYADLFLLQRPASMFVIRIKYEAAVLYLSDAELEEGMRTRMFDCVNTDDHAIGLQVLETQRAVSIEMKDRLWREAYQCWPDGYQRMQVFRRPFQTLVKSKNTTGLQKSPLIAVFLCKFTDLFNKRPKLNNEYDTRFR